MKELISIAVKRIVEKTMPEKSGMAGMPCTNSRLIFDLHIIKVIGAAVRIGVEGKGP